MRKKQRKSRSGEFPDYSMDPVLVRNLAAHGLTAGEMKKIIEEIRGRWWKREHERPEKELA